MSVERRYLRIQLLLQHFYLARSVVEHLRGGSPVGNQFAVALLVLLGLNQLLACGSYLAFHIGFLTLIHRFGSVHLLNLQPRLRGVNEPHLSSCLNHVTLVHIERQQCPTLFGKHGRLGSLERARCIVFFLVVSAGCHHQRHTCQYIYLFHMLNYLSCICCRISLSAFQSRVLTVAHRQHAPD